MFRIEFHCGCGLQNFNKGDWFAHWKYGAKYDKWQAKELWDNPYPNLKNKYPNLKVYTFLAAHPKLRAIWLFLKTKIIITRK